MSAHKPTDPPHSTGYLALFMPFLSLQTSVPLTPSQREELLPPLSRLVAEGIGKPEQYVMITISDAGIRMAGAPGPAAYVDVRSIGGLNRAVNRQLSEQIGALLQERLGIPPKRIYLGFTNVSAENWGWNGTTFG